MEHNILEQSDEQVAVRGFFEGISRILKECDECEEKEKIKAILQNMNDTVSYVFVGEEGVGKTTLFQEIFENILNVQEQMGAEIWC